MKTWMLILIIGLAFISCDNNNGNNDPVLCTCPAGTTHEPNVKCCNGTDCTCAIAEPTVKTFSVSFNFPNASGDVICNVTIKDERTACGSQNLEQLGIKTIIEQEIMGAFNDTETTSSQKTRFRNVFGTTNNGGASIIVNNSATPYKIKATDSSAIYFHIDYLKSNPSDIQQNIISAVVAMNPTSPNLPYNAE
jgi:hypothetical protein